MQPAAHDVHTPDNHLPLESSTEGVNMFEVKSIYLEHWKEIRNIGQVKGYDLLFL